MSEQGTMNTGDVSRRIGIPVTADLLTELGFKPAEKNKRAFLWRQTDYSAMCVSLADWIRNRTDVPMQPAPARTTKKAETAPAGKVNTSAFANDDEI